MPDTAIAGAGKLTKNGTAVLTLSGPATYAGGTDVNAGTLRLGGSNALPDTGTVLVAAGATLDTQGNSDTIAALTVNGSATGGGTMTAGALSLGSGAVFTPSLVLNGTLTKTGATGTTLGSTIDLAGGSDYMAYRIVPVFPQVDTLIGQAMERIVSKQMSAAESMRQAQASAIADLKRAGIRL